MTPSSPLPQPVAEECMVVSLGGGRRGREKGGCVQVTLAAFCHGIAKSAKTTPCTVDGGRKIKGLWGGVGRRVGQISQRPSDNARKLSLVSAITLRRGHFRG